MSSLPLDRLSIGDISAHPVWRFESGRTGDESQLVPVKRLPCEDLRGKVVFTQVLLSNSSRIWCGLGNLDVSNPSKNEHFLTLSLNHEGKWFHLARYHDFDIQERGPKQLATFLGLDEHEIFPIRYNIENPHEIVKHCGAISGYIHQEPTTRLSRSEIIALAVPKRKKS